MIIASRVSSCALTPAWTPAAEPIAIIPIPDGEPSGESVPLEAAGEPMSSRRDVYIGEAVAQAIAAAFGGDGLVVSEVGADGVQVVAGVEPQAFQVRGRPMVIDEGDDVKTGRGQLRLDVLRQREEEVIGRSIHDAWADAERGKLVGLMEEDFTAGGLIDRQLRMTVGGVWKTLEVKVKNLQLPVTPPSRVDIGWTNPQWIEAGLRYSLSEDTNLFFNAGWQEWSTFSENRIGVDSGKVQVLDRNWDDTWYAGIALAHRTGSQSQFSLGLSYDSSPVKDKYRTLDFPLDEMWKLSASYGWERKKDLKFALGGTLALIGDAPLDQTAQGVRVVGDYDSNWMAIVGGTIYYAF